MEISEIRCSTFTDFRDVREMREIRYSSNTDLGEVMEMERSGIAATPTSGTSWR